jgi:Protein of unknown function (DUF3830)
MLDITVGDLQLRARLEDDLAPRTVALFRSLLPLRGRLAQAKWSGNAAWLAFDALRETLPSENATSFPRVGELLLYPGGTVAAELLLPYGPSMFSSNVGLLPGNHFATVVQGGEQLTAIGARCLWDGAQPIEFRSR